MGSAYFKTGFKIVMVDVVWRVTGQAELMVMGPVYHHDQASGAKSMKLVQEETSKGNQPEDCLWHLAWGKSKSFFFWWEGFISILSACS